MTGMSKVSGGNIQPLDSHSQVEGGGNDAIKEKQKNHYNFNGGHEFGANKERLKKMLNDVEKMLASEARKDDDDKDNQFDRSKLDQANKVISQVREQLNNDDTGNKVSHSPNMVDTDRTLAPQGDIVLSGGIAVLYLFMNLLSDLAQFKYLEMQQKAKVSRDAQNMANEVNEIIADVSKQKNSDTYKEQLPTDVIKYMEENGIKIDDKSIDEYVGIDSSLGDYKTDSVTLDGQNLSKDKASISINSDGKYSILYKISPGHFAGKTLSPSQYQVDGNHITVNIDASDVDAGKEGQTLTINASIPERSGKGLDKGQLTAVKSALENTSNRASDFVSQSQLQLQKIMQTYNVTVSLINSMQTLLEEMNKSIAQNIR